MKDISNAQSIDKEISFKRALSSAAKNYVGTRTKIAEDVKPEFGTVLEAQFAQNNTIGSLIANLKVGGEYNFFPDPSYDPTDDIPEDKLQYWQSYIRADTPSEVERISQKIDKEIERNSVIESADLKTQLITGLIAGVADPVNFIPVGGVAYRSSRLGKVVDAARNTAQAGLISTVASESILQSQQETRTTAESLVNIGAATVLSGILGGAAGLISKGDFESIAKSYQDEVNTEKAVFELNPETQLLQDSVGAKRNLGELEGVYKKHVEESLQKGVEPKTFEQFSLENQSLLKTKASDVVVKTVGKLNPILRIFNADSIKAKELLQQMNTHNLLVAKNELGIASQQSIETSIKTWRAPLAEGINVTRKGFQSYKKRVKAEGGEQVLKNPLAFNEAVSKAMRRGDVSDIPEVAQAARTWRTKVFDPLKNEAIQVRLLPEDVQPITAISYLTRRWNRKKVIAQSNVLRQILTKKLKTAEVPKIKNAFKQKELSLMTGINDTNARIAEVENLLDKNASEILSGVKGGFSDNELFSMFDEYKRSSKVLQTEKPKSLLQFIKEEGGIIDRDGELSILGINNKTHPFLLRKDKGELNKAIEYDDVALKAWEAGYFPEFVDRPSVRDLLDAIGRETKGQPVFSTIEEEKVFRRQAAQDFLDELDRQEIDINIISKAKDVRDKKTSKQFSDVKSLILKKEIEILKKSKEKIETRLSAMSQEFNANFGDDVFTDDYIDEVVDNIIDNLSGHNTYNVNMPYDLKITTRGPLKERTLTFVDDVEIEDFLDSDIEKIADGYTRIMATDVELKKQFGDVNLTAQLKEVGDEYRDLIKKAKTEKERVRLNKEMDSVLKDLTALKDIMRGNYGRVNNPDDWIVKGGRIARNINYMSKLGGVVISSFADTARPVMVHGMGRTFNKGLKNLIINTKGIKLNVAEAKKAGNILESVLNTRLATLAELQDPYNAASPAERFFSNLASGFSKVTGMTYWNDAMKGFSSVITQQRLIEESDNLLKGTIKKTDRTYLASLGIGPEQAERITNQIKKHSTKEGGLFVANTDSWTDATAVKIYRNALNQDVDRTIVTKTIGDTPLLLNTEIGKTIGQFKSFTFAATQQVLIAGLQQKDAAALQGVITSITMGAMVYYLKTIGAGKEPSDDPRVWLAEGVDRSGIMGILMEANNISEKVTRGRVGINALTGGEIMSRYASRNISGTLLGPTLGTIEDAAKITGAIATGDISESDVRAFRRMTPYQNVFYLRGLFDELEAGINKNIGPNE